MKALIKAVLQWSVAGMLISLSQAIEPVGGYTTESVTHGQTCDARPTVTFSAAEYHHHLATASTKLYCLVTEAHVCVCEQLVPLHESGTAGSRTCDVLVASPTSRHNITLTLGTLTLGTLTLGTLTLGTNIVG